MRRMTSERGVTKRRAGPLDRDLRCPCGSLVARITSAGVELKCRRCKRVVLLGALGRTGRWTEMSPR
jgi:hypothetical protein